MKEWIRVGSCALLLTNVLATTALAQDEGSVIEEAPVAEAPADEASLVEETPVVEEVDKDKDFATYLSQRLGEEIAEGNVLTDEILDILVTPYVLTGDQQVDPRQVAFKDIAWDDTSDLAQAAITADYWYNFYAGQLTPEQMQVFQDAIAGDYQSLVDNLRDVRSYLSTDPLSQDALDLIRQVDQLNITYYETYTSKLYNTLGPILEEVQGRSEAEAPAEESNGEESTTDESTTDESVEESTVEEGTQTDENTQTTDTNNGNQVNQNQSVVINNNVPNAPAAEEGEQIPFEIRRYTNYNLAPGTEQIVQQGVPGVRAKDGSILRYPVHQVIEFNPAGSESAASSGESEASSDETPSESKPEESKPDGNTPVLPGDESIDFSNVSNEDESQGDESSSEDDKDKESSDKESSDDKKDDKNDNKDKDNKDKDNKNKDNKDKDNKDNSGNNNSGSNNNSGGNSNNSNSNSNSGGNSKESAQPAQTQGQNRPEAETKAEGDGQQAQLPTLGTTHQLGAEDGRNLSAVLQSGQVEEDGRVNEYQTIRLVYNITNNGPMKTGFKPEDFRLYKWSREGDAADEYNKDPQKVSTIGEVEPQQTAEGLVYFQIPQRGDMYRLTWAPYGDGQYKEWYFGVDSNGAAVPVSQPAEQKDAKESGQENKQGAETKTQPLQGDLPDTGEKTSYWLIGAGVLLIGAALALFGWKKKQDEDDRVE